MATTGELSSIEEHVRAWYRLVSSLSGDDALTERGETVDDIAYLSLTRGYRAAQRWMIDQGGGARWRKRSQLITAFSGSDDADGGRYVDLDDVCTDGASPPNSDFLKLDSTPLDKAGYRSAFTSANGTAWGQEAQPDQDWNRGDGYYLQGERLWLLRGAETPFSLYLRYFYRIPAITSATTTFDMDVDARWLAVAEAASAAVNDEWVPGGADVVAKVDRALARARDECRRLVRRTRGPLTFRGVAVAGSHW